MQITQKLVSNFDETSIEVHYLVLHYTSLDLNKTIERFNQKDASASAHFVIDLDGSIYECVQALDKKINQPFQAWHSGASFYNQHHNLNQYAIGIELVNRNGNFFNYTNNQYQALIWLCQKLQEKYPNLNHPKNIVGHEQIAGYRGKIDPGFCFNWAYFLKQVFPKMKQSDLNELTSNRSTIKPELFKSIHSTLKLNSSKPLELKSHFWSYLNTWLEHSQKSIMDNQKD